MAEESKKYAVVTGSNKGIGYEICRQLASKGIVVIFTARDEKRGLEAFNKLKQETGLSDFLVFHQLDVADISSINSLADFIRSQFGKLDILVNNAAVLGAITDDEYWKRVTEVIDRMVDIKATKNSILQENARTDWSGVSLTETYELAEECIAINYYGAKRTAEALIPLLQLSNSPRIVNVSSSSGKLKNFPDGWVEEMLADAENLTEERLDRVLTQLLQDFKEGSLESKKCWPSVMAPYMISKAAMNAYTRILAKKYTSFCINCVCPGFVRTDITLHNGIYSAEEGGESVVRLAMLPTGGPSGLFFNRNEEAPF